MKKRGCMWMVIALAGLAGLAVITGGLANNYTPNIDTQLNMLQPAVIVSIVQPTYAQQVTPGEPIAIFVASEGAEILQTLQAYADDIPLAHALSTPAGETSAKALYYWTPNGEGWHVLTARGLTASGRTVTANPIWVKAAAPKPASALPPTDETPAIVFGISTDTDDFEQALDAEVERMLFEAGDDARTGSDLPAPIPPIPMTIAVLPTGTLLTPPTGTLPAAPAEVSPLVKSFLWLIAQTNIPVSIPAAPQIFGVVDDCTVQLSVHDTSENELGFRIYRTSPGDNIWKLVADLGSHSGTGWFAFEDTQRSQGKHAYYAAAYNAAGKSHGPFILLEVTRETCAANSPVAISLQNAMLTPHQPVDRLYCYASTNNADWRRIPSDTYEFLMPFRGAFNLSPFLKAIASPGAQVDLTFECWGWHGSVLIPLGRASGAIAEGPLVFDGNAYSFGADTILEPFIPSGHAYKPLNFAHPYYLHYADSLAGCMAYTGHDAYLDWACENLIDQWGKPVSGHNILVWHWNIHNGCNAQENYCGYNLPKEDVAGYHIYRQTENNDPILIRTVDRNDVYMAVLTPGETTSASQNTRYFVRAFTQDGWESGDSNYLLAKPAPFRMTIPAQYIHGISVRVFKPGKIVGVDITPDPLEQVLDEQTEEGFQVGYMRHHSDHMPKSISFIWDTWVQFDLSQVAGTITNALLKWDGELEMVGPGWDKWDTWCGNQMTTFYGWSVGYDYLLPSNDNWGIDITNLVLIQQQVESANYSMGGLTPYYFGFYMWSGMRTHYTTEYKLDACYAGIRNVRLEVEYIK